MKHGFYLTIGNTDWFFVTERKRKDNGTLNAILRKLRYAPTESLRRELDYFLSKGTAEVRYTETTKLPYWSIRYGNGNSCVSMPYEDLKVIEL